MCIKLLCVHRKTNKQESLIKNKLQFKAKIFNW